MDTLFKEKVIEVIAEVLELELDEVGFNDALVDDLGADSLDIVDLSFSLGKAFQVQMPQKSVIAYATELSGEDGLFVMNERLTEHGAQLLQQSPFKYSAEHVFEGASLTDVYVSTTVSNWASVSFAIKESGLAGEVVIQQYVSSFCEKLKDTV
ncbi:acyl carrier protein [Photobacterium rosenbergii]|uniref:Acyl carrier protein n=1 Tax=Photobacterium rosenbergii TaxID=294936 RepID=A0ABU3ZQM9_9GAMM|nr:acyl carrier protein [Photobacterium rosenbergii]MDV5172362.1 acyl carrier protein [Photobacterium rosenbergii]